MFTQYSRKIHTSLFTGTTLVEPFLSPPTSLTLVFGSSTTSFLTPVFWHDVLCVWLGVEIVIENVFISALRLGVNVFLDGVFFSVLRLGVDVFLDSVVFFSVERLGVDVFWDV